MQTEGLELVASEAGCRLRLRVMPGARQSRIVGPHGTALKITVAAPPERGRANDAVRRLLAESLDLPASRIRIVAGLASRDKVASIEGCLPDEIRRRIERLP